jgi:hypothetical protein
MRSMRFHIKAASGRCCPVVWTDAECIHAISLSRISVSRWCCPSIQTGASCLPTPCLQRKVGIFSNSEEHPDVLPWCPNGCNLELFEASRHCWASGCMTGPSRHKHGIRLLWVEICIESFLNTWNSFFEIYGIPVYDSNITWLWFCQTECSQQN